MYSNETIIEKALERYVEGWNNSVLYNIETEELEHCSYTGNTSFSENYIEIYRLDNNWISNNNWNDFDILSKDEIEKIKKIKGDDFFLQYDMHDQKLLESIGVDYWERIKDYLIFMNQNNDIWENGIIEE